MKVFRLKRLMPATKFIKKIKGCTGDELQVEHGRRVEWRKWGTCMHGAATLRELFQPVLIRLFHLWSYPLNKLPLTKHQSENYISR